MSTSFLYLVLTHNLNSSNMVCLAVETQICSNIEFQYHKEELDFVLTQKSILNNPIVN